MKDTQKKTFREITEQWERGERGEHYIKLAQLTNLSYSTITSAKTRGCRAKTGNALTRGMIELGFCEPGTTRFDLFPENK